MYLDQGAIVEAFKPTRTPIIQPSPTALPTVVPTVPDVFHETIGETGRATLWVVCVLMALSSIAFYYLAFRVPVQKRLFHVLTAFITTFAFLSYFAMATGDGVSVRTVAKTETNQHIVTEIYTRQVFWARYVDWSLTTPLLLLDLSLLAGLNGASILIAIVADLIMVLTGLFAAFGDVDSQRWGWYTIACIAYLVIIYQIARNGSTAVAKKDAKTKRFFSLLAGFTLILWTIYPIVWGVADGAWNVSVDTEIVAYAVLDILAKPVFGLWLLIMHDQKSRNSPSIEGFWAHGFASEGTLRVSIRTIKILLI
ncbi:bacteriorhodopsin [Xylariales sp. AK1849]|nr:bacteriorhodopsin [Xylariales sp. AK1849]